TNRIHRDDCAGVLRHLLDLRAPEPLYVAVDDEPASQCEVYRWIAARIGAPAPRAEPGARPRRNNKRCRNARLHASGYVFRYPTYREGYGSLIDAGG
ncbi:MAG: SDR family oxidoreductase, partial [Candidatus Binatia bacterium]